MKTILITGGAGFIGSAFTRHIYNNHPDYRIIVIDNLTYAGSVDNFPVTLDEHQDDRFTFVYGDINNGELVDSLVSQSDIVVHFAAESHVTRSISDNTQFFRTDVLGTQTLANAICRYKKRIQRFIHISTSEVYGSALTDGMDEDHPLNPMSPYAAAKVGADRLVYSYWATYGIPVIIVRPFNNYGPRQHLEKVIPRFITSVLREEKLRVHGDGESARDFIHVQDTCSAIDLLMFAPEEKVIGEVFNLGTGEDRTILSIAERVIDIMGGSKRKITYVGDRPGQVIRHTADFSKIKDVLGWEPQITWEDGISKTISWYSEYTEWWKKQLWLREIPITSISGKQELH